MVMTPADYGQKITDDIEKAVGDKKKITKTDPWGVKNLSYPIKKRQEASYFLFGLTLESSEISPLDQMLRRNENILRYLLVRGESKFKSKTENLRKVKPAVKKVEKKIKTKKPESR